MRIEQLVEIHFYDPLLSKVPIDALRFHAPVVSENLLAFYISDLCGTKSLPAYCIQLAVRLIQQFMIYHMMSSFLHSVPRPVIQHLVSKIAELPTASISPQWLHIAGIGP